MLDASCVGKQNFRIQCYIKRLRFGKLSGDPDRFVDLTLLSRLCVHEI